MIQKLRQEFSLAILLDVAQLPRATFYYHLKQLKKADKYHSVKEEITAIFHENKEDTVIDVLLQNFEIGIFI